MKGIVKSFGKNVFIFFVFGESMREKAEGVRESLSLFRETELVKLDPMSKTSSTTKGCPSVSDHPSLSRDTLSYDPCLCNGKVDFNRDLAPLLNKVMAHNKTP